MTDKKLARVFPRKTNMSPTDDLAFFGYPTIEALAMDIDEVHISVTFSWDLQKAEDLYEQWQILGVPVEVVHGRWCFMGLWEECSVCKHPIFVDGERTNYCPNCGAKMDGDGDG